MKWIMRKEFDVAYTKAKEVLESINYKKNEMIRTASLIDAVERMLKVDVKYTDYNFAELSDTIDVKDYGAAMCVSHTNDKVTATILLNDRETPEMQRFSLVHELGHLITKPNIVEQEYQISTHINMDITSIPDEILDNPEYHFLIEEQIANIFALLVLIPYDMLIMALSKYDTFDEAARFFGVEKNALISRLLLECPELLESEEEETDAR